MARNYRTRIFTDNVYKPVAVAVLSLALLSPGEAGCTLSADDSHGQSGDGQAAVAPALLVATEVGLAFLAAGAVLAVAGENANISLLFSQQGGSAVHSAAHAIISEQAAISGAQQLAQHTLNVSLQEQHITDFANAYVTLPEELGFNPKDHMWQTFVLRVNYDPVAREEVLGLVLAATELDEAAAALEEAVGPVLQRRGERDVSGTPSVDSDGVLQDRSRWTPDETALENRIENARGKAAAGSAGHNDTLVQEALKDLEAALAEAEARGQLLNGQRLALEKAVDDAEDALVQWKEKRLAVQNALGDEDESTARENALKERIRTARRQTEVGVMVSPPGLLGVPGSMLEPAFGEAIASRQAANAREAIASLQGGN
ncbi:MAG: hypothetical protein H6715_04810 [Myxococcales bacterium]|nr:hypothetical protein [Myxococcales bacterium]MCB9708482.1 hypothetical protein [Myxococcales bacterium]